jgi:hypothetical protein
LFYIFVSFLLVWAVPLLGQNGVEMAKQAWVSTYWYWRIDDRYVFNQDVAIQGGMGREAFSRLFLRSQLNRRMSKTFSLHGGLILIGTRDALDSNTVEIRPWCGVRATWPRIWKIGVSHYLRLEQRFVYEYLPGYWDPGFRFRYRLGALWPLNHSSLTSNTLFTVLSYEMLSNSFRSFGKKGRIDDFHKFDIGLGYVLGKTVRVELLFVSLDAYQDTRATYLPTRYTN